MILELLAIIFMKLWKIGEEQEGWKMVNIVPLFEDLVALLDHRFNASLQYDVATEKVNLFFFIKTSTRCDKWEKIVPLYTALVRLHLEYAVFGLHVLERTWTS